jgi:hypothetical protein
MRRGALSYRLRTAGLLLALFALTFKAFLPPGYMLAPVGAQLVVTLCSVDGPVDVAIGGPAQHAPDDGQAKHDAPCVFAMAAALSTPEPAPLVPVPRVANFARNDASGDVGVALLALAAPPPWATGPPTRSD